MASSTKGAKVTTITLEISDSIHQWLNAEAGNRGLSLDQFVTSFLAEQHSKTVPTANEISVLGILQNVSERRGWVVPAKLLRSIWNIRGNASELETALRGLISKGFAEESPNGIGYTLTAFGYSFQTKPAFA
jgi:hypothetical protein